MFTNLFRKNGITKEIEDCLSLMRGLKQDSAEYLKQIAVLKELTKIKNDSRSFSWDTVWHIGGSIAGILIITNKEKLDILATKAWGYVWKGRV